MSDTSYSYHDPDYAYTDPATGVLRNLADITDANALAFAESGAVAKRLAELDGIFKGQVVFKKHGYLS
jgi:fido (protein-threonine AMPylation protein)